MLPRRSAVWMVAAIAAVLTAASASAVPTAANVQLNILVGTGDITVEPPAVPNGGTANVSVLNFIAGLSVSNAGPDVVTVKVRFELPAGLSWGADGPDPSEDCTESQTPVCEAALGNSPATPPSQRAGWGWNVVASSPGTYTLKAQVVESSTSDPDTSNNAASVTVVVTQPTGGGGAGKAIAGAVKLTPAKPKAGSLVAATVRVTAGGNPIKPTGVSCTGRLATAKLKGTPRAASGIATCSYRTPKSGKGKTLRGTVSFSARGTKFTKAFSTKLR